MSSRVVTRIASTPPVLRGANSGSDCRHLEASGVTATVEKLLTTEPPVRTYTGTQQPCGALSGMRNTSWSSPAQQGVRPLYCAVAGTPPTKISTLVGRLPAVGATVSFA